MSTLSGRQINAGKQGNTLRGILSIAGMKQMQNTPVLILMKMEIIPRFQVRGKPTSGTRLRGLVMMFNGLQLKKLGGIKMEFLRKLFQKSEPLKMCRVKFLSGKIVTCPASIETLSELLMTCSAGTEIEVLG